MQRQKAQREKGKVPPIIDWPIRERFETVLWSLRARIFIALRCAYRTDDVRPLVSAGYPYTKKRNKNYANPTKKIHAHPRQAHHREKRRASEGEPIPEQAPGTPRNLILRPPTRSTPPNPCVAQRCGSLDLVPAVVRQEYQNQHPAPDVIPSANNTQEALSGLEPY